MGDRNTADGYSSLNANTSGSDNTAIGYYALVSNTANGNTATGSQTLRENITGSNNTANGFQALYSNTTANHNTANGVQALFSNTTGNFNTANGSQALRSNTTGGYNTANGLQALASNTTGSDNMALGSYAGYNITGDGNVCIGASVYGGAGVDNTTWIRNIYASVATARQVYVDADDKIGTFSSSRRYKEEIKPMGEASEALFALKPVTFRYKKEIDRSRALSFGLIAEEVANISPDLITRDEEGQPQTVRYEAINAMLLNEFLKEHKKVQQQETKIGGLEVTAAKQEATIAGLKSTVVRQQKAMDVMTARLEEQVAQLQKVSAQTEANKPQPQLILNSH
jgi:trimeric autotransporter adhesin